MKRQITNALSVVLLSASLFAGAANAADRTVDASDLDLQNPHDAAILYERIRLAAAMVCRTDSASWDSQVNTNFNRCKKSVIDNAISRFNQPLLTAVHEQTIDQVARN